MNEYRPLTEEEKEMIYKHRLWLDDAEGGERADFSDADFHGVDMEGVNLHYATLCRTNFEDANLENSDLRQTCCIGMNCTNANLCNVDFSQANLERADFTNADMKECNLKNAALFEAHFYNTDLRYACFPLWCGSLGLIADDKLACQLVYHLSRLDVSQCSEGIQKVINDLMDTPLAKGLNASNIYDA